MKTSEERIKELARARSVSDEEAARLLDAVRTPTVRPAREPLRKNPFARFSGEVTAPAGVLVCGLGLLASRLGVRFDGAFDVHTTSGPVPWGTALVDQLVAFPLTALVFGLVARSVSRHARVVDVAGVVGLARLPPTILAVLVALFAREFGGEAPLSIAVLLALALTGIGAHVYYLFVGFRTVSAPPGGRVAAPFIVAVIVAEIASKLALHFA